MSKRLQVILDDEEYEEIQRVARRHRMNVSEWVRDALRRARRAEPAVEAGRKLEAVQAAVRHEFPTADIDQMLREIERGHLDDTPHIQP
ncbi:MAG TPA: ribbon-helix-helix protein, CopG family [Gemmatimonadota bacterium]|nr:ribbon-helix-helix protein, CopG family [Gemmatimonadota bacterium]